jgi:hypothetical protein
MNKIHPLLQAFMEPGDSDVENMLLEFYEIRLKKTEQYYCSICSMKEAYLQRMQKQECRKIYRTRARSCLWGIKLSSVA